jgi:hypothetical protein
MTSATMHLRVRGPTRWTSSRGGSAGIPQSFGARAGMRPRCLLREVPEPNAISRSRPFGDERGTDRTEPDKAGTPLPSLDVRVEGRRSGWAARRNVPSKDRAARRAVASENVIDPKPKGASSGRAAATSRASQRTPRRKKALRSTRKSGAPWRHGSGHGSNGEKEHQSVNAIASERTRRGDGMVEAAEEGNAS